ncbi:MAG: trigger factor, partial [Bifidobacteriaceae bacterium]|nr:trigger factor [Aeriscardovia sp.]MBQ1803886.1 trigger factor [Bifidobacteriaceae bacterium]
MKVTINRLDPTKVQLDITASGEDLAPFINKERDVIAHRISIPGFRKGHVPAKLIDAKVGYGYILDRAMDGIVKNFYQKALQENKNEVRPIDAPQISINKLPEKPGEDLSFEAQVVIRPDITLPKIDGEQIKVEVPEVDEEKELNEALTKLRHNYSTLVETSALIKTDNYVDMDLKVFDTDKEIESKREPSYRVGSSELPGLDKALRGMRKGEEATFTFIPKSGENKGKELRAEVKVNDVKREELPKLDDEFAKEASEFDTVDELKEAIKKQISARRDALKANAAKEAFMNYLEGVDIPLPMDMIKSLSDEQIAKLGKDATKAQKAEITSELEKAMKEQIVLDQLADDLNVEITEGDITRFLGITAQQFNIPLPEFINMVIKNGQLEETISTARHQKAMVEGMKKADFVDKDGKKLDLSAFLGDEEEEEREKKAMGEARSMAAASLAAKKADEAGREASSPQKPSKSKKSSVKSGK